MPTHGAFISARYSTDNQNPDSIEVQVESCSQWCAEHGLPVLGVYADMAVSGMKDTRPQFEAMMRDLHRGLADTVVIYDQSRMFRKMSAWFSFRDEMTRLGVTVVSVTQPNIGGDLRDPMNFLSEGSMALFNQIWALQTRQKVIEKMRYMARNGQHTGGKPALGYQVVDGHLEIQEEEAKIVRRIFREYADGQSYKRIIDGLNADGIKTKRGNTFGSNSLHDLLKNEKYIGTLVYGGAPRREDGSRNSHAAAAETAIRIEGVIPAIIDKELFKDVQRRMEKNKKIHSGRPATLRDYPLKGKVFCAECSSAMNVSISKRSYFYYMCTGKARLHNCDIPPIRVNALEKIVTSYVRQLLGKPDNIEELVDILRIQSDSIQDGAVARLRALIAQENEIAAQLDNAVNAVLNGLNSPAVTAKIQGLEKQKAKIKSDMNTLRTQVAATSINEDRLREILDTIISAPESDNSAILSIVSRVEVGKTEIKIWTILSPTPGDPHKIEPGEVIETVGLPSPAPLGANPNFAFICGTVFVHTKKHSLP